MSKEIVKSGYGVSVVLDPSRAEMRQMAQHAKEGLYKQAPYKKIAVYLDQWVQRNFKSEGDLAERGGWKEFSPSNLRFKKDSRAKLLQDTGRLRSSFQPFYNVFNAGIGSQIHYADKHEEGIGNLPQRKMLPTEKQVWPEAAKILRQHTKEVLNKAFRFMRRGA